MGSRELPIEMRLDYQPIQSSTTMARVDAATWALATTLPTHGLQLHSTYLASRQSAEVAVSRLTISPAGHHTTASQVPYEELPLPESIRSCLYDHLQAVQDAVLQADLGELQVENLKLALAEVTPT